MRSGSSGKLRFIKVWAIVLTLSFILSGLIIFTTENVSADQDGDYSYTVSDGKATITGYTGAGGDIIIPSTLGGYPTAAIGDGAFSYRINQTSVNIPDSVTSIGEWAFQYCTSLTSVTIGNNVTSIGLSAFYYCTSLTFINVSPSNPIYASVDGVLFNKALTTLIKCPGGKNDSFTFPDSVTSIGNSAFRDCTSLTSVAIGNNVTSISDWAFSGCWSLSSVTIGNNVTSIGHYAFYGCSVLTSISLGNNLTFIGTMAFWGCSSLVSIYIPSSVNQIDSNAFIYCNNLTSINVSINNQNFTSIDGVLYSKDLSDLIRCPGGKNGSFNIPNGVKVIDTFALNSCSKITSVIIPPSVRTIQMEAFSACVSLVNVTIPDSVESIESDAFYYCLSLNSIDVDASNLYYCSIDGILYERSTNELIRCPPGKTGLVILPMFVKSIGYTSFADCSHIVSVTIPDNVTNIGVYAFERCTSLTSINIPANVTSIGYCAFHYCTALISITIPDNVTNIGSQTFYQCISLKTITMGNNITGIGADAFYNCTSLISINIPGSVIIIGRHAFDHCASLISITFIGLSAPIVDEYWLVDTNVDLEGHAYHDSNFPVPGELFFGLTMGDYKPDTVPSSPVYLSATTSNMQVNLTWINPVDTGGKIITVYNIYRAESENGVYEQIAISLKLNYTDTNITSGQRYWYKVSAVNVIGEGNQSNPVWATPFAVQNVPIGSDTSTMIAIASILGLAIAAVVLVMYFRRQRKVGQ